MTVTELLPKPHPSALVDPHKASSGWCSWVITHPVQWLSFRLTLIQQCNTSGGIAYPKKNTNSSVENIANRSGGIAYPKYCTNSAAEKFRTVGGECPTCRSNCPCLGGGGRITFVVARKDRWSGG